MNSDTLYQKSEKIIRLKATTTFIFSFFIIAFNLKQLFYDLHHECDWMIVLVGLILLAMALLDYFTVLHLNDF